MLILKAPIGLKNRTDYISADDSFYNRISANYSLMGSDIGTADLLHAFTSPPEIFIGEGDITTVSGDTFINSRNEEKLNIINNLLNRIIVNADMPLTYQDRVYISDVLYKIGIRNDERFMNEVRRIRMESEESNNFITEVLTRGEEARDVALRQYVNSFLRNIERNDSPLTQKLRETYLSREITDRLHTGAIYQILANFNTGLRNDYISRNEFQLSEQVINAREMLSERLMERITGERGELIYRNDNIYEEEFLSEEHEDNTVSNEITAAVLLDMVRNLYATGYERVENDNRKWMEFRDIFYNSSENTLMRLKYITSESFTERLRETERVSAEIEFPEAETVEESPEDARKREENMLIRSLQEINERNVRNLEKYRRMISVLDRVRDRRARGNGENLTMDAAREMLRHDTNPLEIIKNREEDAGETSEMVFREIERLFPEEYEHINEILSQYSNSVQNSNIQNTDISNLITDIESINLENRKRELILRDRESLSREELRELNELLERDRVIEEMNRETVREIEEGRDLTHNTVQRELLEEIRNREEESETLERIRERSIEVSTEIEKVRDRGRAAAPASGGGNYDVPGAEIVHKSNETITREEIEETLNEFKKNAEVNKNVSERSSENTAVNRNVVRTSEESINHITDRQIDDIQALIDRGVRGRMETISNEVMRRLEKRLQNEKSRRGI